MKNRTASNFDIFRRGSTTYFYSSILFPPDVRKKVFTLYAFVRVADNFVDDLPQDKKGFLRFYDMTTHCLNGKKVPNLIIREMVDMSKALGIPDSWIMAFLNAMEKDLHIQSYSTYKQLKANYMYGSAEVIGLMMSKILDLPKKSYKHAMAQGEAMQLVNFIRDIREDISLKRVYIPQESFEKYKVSGFCPESKTQEVNLKKMIRSEVRRYFKIQSYAEEGYKYIPKRYLTSIKTANDMYKWTAKEIYKNPLIVLSKKIKPHPAKVISQYFVNYASL